MLSAPATDHRPLREQHLVADLVVVGGGLAGACAAIAAARTGIKVILVQDRPVLGGNASSEVRLWILGATSHMGNNNRWAREGGIVDELLVENTWRNPEGNPCLVDALLLEKATAEKNLTLLLNTAVHEVLKEAGDRIAAVRGFCAQNSTAYELRAPLFCDASGDGIVGFLAGAAFRMGAESREEFGERFAPTKEYGELLGHSLYFYSKDAGRPVNFTAPAFALRDITKIPRYRSFATKDFGCRLWWLEYGGRLDTVHDTEQIKWELWRVVYGVWDHIKNSGKFPDAANLTLEWVGTIPGKRESRRFEGDTWLIQQDIVEQRPHADAVAFGGWSIDLHPADGVFSEKPGCNQWHAKGIYEIPYRCVYSRNIPNLFLAGRIISASHVAFGSSRVMGTCACIGEAVGVAAALCHRYGLTPRELGSRHIGELQRGLLRIGHYIPRRVLDDPTDLARRASITTTSEFAMRSLPPD
ncbi:MAG TPA: FAD-dependent oxidoreductase, partial [Lacunisphaera sp.]|nr:FAD-dependent oxidoreductase [Lacunisphaera sp.]